MKISKFAFELGTRVNVPKGIVSVLTDGFEWPEDGYQGVVSGRKQMVGRENEYDVHVLQSDLSLGHIVCGEAVLIEAQPVASKPAARKRSRR